jgi:hypothetical protein
MMRRLVTVCGVLMLLSLNVSAQLKPSGKTSLLGVVLPTGAVMTDKERGDADRDPNETYRIASSANELSAFFLGQLSAGGWKRIPPLNDDRELFYERGLNRLAILINGDGKTFMVISSKKGH